MRGIRGATTTACTAGFLVLLALSALGQQRGPSPVPFGDDYEVEITEALPYVPGAAKGDDRVLDLYAPRPRPGDPVDRVFPCLVFAHGGTWTVGSRSSRFERLPDFARSLARAGIAVAMIDYRLSPKVKHPSHVEDLAQAFAWVRTAAANRRLDPDNLFVGGHSAGGHMASLLATCPAHLAAVGLKATDIRGAIGVSGVYSVKLVRHVLPHVFPAGKKTTRDASPVEHASAGDPPFLILAGTRDLVGLEGQASRMHRRLKKSGVDSTFFLARGAGHVEIMHRAGETDSRTHRAIVRFLRTRSAGEAGRLALKDESARH